ncbi:MAG: F0F1 ATP synthase subunit gamma, partial [Pirellulaceae bacterium]|nr:F0F1 ATP synthase subunit gamma [Pirellulaceae bacterium]
MTRHALIASHTYDAPASLEGVTRLLTVLTQDVLDDYQANRIGSLDVVAARFDGVGHFTPVAVQVLPIESVTAARPCHPSPYVDLSRLARLAVQEFLYITLYELMLVALAAEHCTRLTAAVSA